MILVDKDSGTCGTHLRLSDFQRVFLNRSPHYHAMKLSGMSVNCHLKAYVDKTSVH